MSVLGLNLVGCPVRMAPDIHNGDAGEACIPIMDTLCAKRLMMFD